MSDHRAVALAKTIVPLARPRFAAGGSVGVSLQSSSDPLSPTPDPFSPTPEDNARTIQALMDYASREPPLTVPSDRFLPGQGTYGEQLLQSAMDEPARIGMGIWNAVTLPGDVYAGRVDPASDEGLQRTFGLAGMLAGAPEGDAISATESLASRRANLYNPPSQNLRPFEADYGAGNPIPADAAGNLTADIEGRPLGARYVVGRQNTGGLDRPFESENAGPLSQALTGKPPQKVAPGDLPYGAVGATLLTPAARPTDVLYSTKLADHEIAPVLNHEFGHVIDELADQIPTAGIQTELSRVYNDLNTSPNDWRMQKQAATGIPVPRKYYTTPETFGYSTGDVPREYIAEAIRGYLTDPNYMKSVAPKTSAVIRNAVNANPRLNKTIQFNASGLPLFLSGGQQNAPAPFSSGGRALFASGGTKKKDSIAAPTYSLTPRSTMPFVMPSFLTGPTPTAALPVYPSHPVTASTSAIPASPVAPVAGSGTAGSQYGSQSTGGNGPLGSIDPDVAAAAALQTAQSVSPVPPAAGVGQPMNISPVSPATPTGLSEPMASLAAPIPGAAPAVPTTSLTGSGAIGSDFARDSSGNYVPSFAGATPSFNSNPALVGVDPSTILAPDGSDTVFGPSMGLSSGLGTAGLGVGSGVGLSAPSTGIGSDNAVNPTESGYFGPAIEGAAPAAQGIGSDYMTTPGNPALAGYGTAPDIATDPVPTISVPTTSFDFSGQPVSSAAPASALSGSSTTSLPPSYASSDAPVPPAEDAINNALSVAAATSPQAPSPAPSPVTTTAPMDLASSLPSLVGSPIPSTPTTIGTNQPISPNSMTTPLGATLSPAQQDQLALMGALEGPNQQMQFGVMDNRGFLNGDNPATEAGKNNQTALTSASGQSEVGRTLSQLDAARQNLSDFTFNGIPTGGTYTGWAGTGSGGTNIPNHPSATLGNELSGLGAIQSQGMSPPSQSYTMPSGLMGTPTNINYSGPSVADLPSANGVIGQTPPSPGPESSLAGPIANGVGDLDAGAGNPASPGPENDFGISPASPGPEAGSSGPNAPGDQQADIGSAASSPSSPGPENSGPIGEAMSADITGGFGEAIGNEAGEGSVESGTEGEEGTNDQGPSESGEAGPSSVDTTGQSGPNVGDNSSDSMSTGIGSDYSTDPSASGYSNDSDTGTPSDDGTPVADSGDDSDAGVSVAGGDDSGGDDSSGFAWRGGFIEHALKVAGRRR